MAKVEIAAWLKNADPALVSHLHSITSGNPDWLALLWDDLWSQEKVQPHPTTYRWEPAPGYQLATLGTVHDILIERLRRLLPDTSPEKLTQALDLLGCAAFEGVLFTPAAIAATLDWDSDELIDFLDDHLSYSENQAYGIVEEVDYLAIPDGETERYVWRYRFVSDLFWQTLSNYNFASAERADYFLKLADNLVTTYGSQERRIADVLAKLYSQAGSTNQASHYMWMAYHREEANTLYMQARTLMSTDTKNWTTVEYAWAARLLNDAAEVMIDTYPYLQTIEVTAAAYTFSRTGGLASEESQALYIQGIGYSKLGEQQKALGFYNQALPLTRQVGNRGGEAAVLTGIGGVYSNLGEQQKALDFYNLALPLSQEVGDRGEEAAVLISIGAIYSDLGEQQKALSFYNQALPLMRQTG